MSNKLIRESFIDKITQVSIDLGKIASEIGANIDPVSGTINPLGLCKIVFDMVEKSNVDNFITAVLTDKKLADIKSLDTVKPLKRLYRATQAIHKVMTQEKINRFKLLTVNGIRNKESLSDDKFELFINLIDELTDTEFLIMSIINRIEEEHSGEKFDIKVSKATEKQILAELSMDNYTFISYITRLKGKGMITPLISSVNINSEEMKEIYGDMILTSGSTEEGANAAFCINNVNGHVSELFKQLLEYIN